MSKYIISNGSFCELPADELMHYGVVGMKWGVRRARSKEAAIQKLRQKALNYDKKSATLTKKSEKAHSSMDLERANRAATKAAKQAKKAAKARMKIANNERYIATMNRKISSLSKEELAGSYSFVNDYLKDNVSASKARSNYERNRSSS